MTDAGTFFENLLSGKWYKLLQSDFAGTATPTATPTPEPTPEPTPVPTVYQYAPGSVQLSEGEMRGILAAAGWPEELHDQALEVAWCESRWRPGAAGDSGNSLGLFQLNGLWFRYTGTAVGLWADPVVNARVAYATYRYDIERGNEPWKQWSCSRVLTEGGS